MSGENKKSQGRSASWNAHQKPAGNKPVSRSELKRRQKEQVSFASVLETYISERINMVLWVSVALTVIFGMLLFDARISTGGDDSAYIEMGYNFLKGKSFPSWHGTLYSIFLAMLIKFTGINIIALKAFSFLFIVFHLIIFYYTFRDHLPVLLFSAIMLITSVNSSILYFASQTYSEALYMFLQAVFVMIFVRAFALPSVEDHATGSKELKASLLAGLMIMLLTVTRNIGIVALFAALAYLLSERKFRAAAFVTLSCFVSLAIYSVYKTAAWEGTSFVTGQLEEILLKNTYNAAEGKEDLAGMITRFFLNARLYLSKHFMIGIGLHSPSSTGKNWFVTIIVAGLLIYSFFESVKKDRMVFFISMYTGASLAGTFIALQITWDQMRMVIIYIPLMLIIITWGILKLSQRKKYSSFRLILSTLMVLIFLGTFGQTLGKVKSNGEALVRNLKGDRYYGFTPDWQNFLAISERAGSNVPDSIKIASRKSSMSFIYSGGREFYGIYRLPTVTPEEMSASLSERYSNLVAIPYASFSPLTREAGILIKTGVLGIVAQEDRVYGIFNRDERLNGLIDHYLSSEKQPVMSLDSLFTELGKVAVTPYAVYPDSLLNELKSNNVGYVILASLRAKPDENTGRIINTVQRYIYFIDLKYPDLVQPVQQSGEADNEPAALFRILYEMYNL